MLEDKLEIFIITYRRARFLDRTLGQLQTSPFAGCRVTILDNCSPDETPGVCVKYQPLFRRLSVIRHPKNIGGLANYLRTIELSKSLYTWIVCDDDEFDFSDCADVLEAIESERFDLISIGAPRQAQWERGVESTTKGLLDRGTRFFFVFSFIPSLIFRTELYDSDCIQRANLVGGDQYPQFVFLNKCLENDVSVYVSRSKLILRNLAEDYYSFLFWFTSWANSCRSTIRDQQIRKKAIEEAFPSGSLLKNLLVTIHIDKTEAKKDHYLKRSFPENIVLLGLAFTPAQRIQLALLTPFIVVPAPLYRAGHKAYLFIKSCLGLREFKLQQAQRPEALR